MFTEFQHDDLGAKSFNTIQRKVHEKLNGIKDSTPVVAAGGNSVSELLEDVELFDDLGEEDRAFLEKNASIITFLAGDTIIGAYEKGDNFYIIAQGKASVWSKNSLGRDHRVAEFSDGEVMGESSLLAEHESGRHVRTATIKAETPCTLIKIALRPMLAIQKKCPAVKDALQEIHDARMRNAP